jgi:hypothetical protein
LSGKKISDLSPVPSGTPASQLFLETARQISAGVWAGESEQVGVTELIALLAAAGASLSVNITSLLNDRGTYSPSATYTRYDFVAYGGGHYAYVNGTPGSGNTPPNATYWVLISVDGKSAISTITDATPAPIPAVGAQATYGVDSSAGMVVGQIIGIGAASTLSVVSTPTGTSVTVQNVDAVVGPVVTGAKIAAAGRKGDPGLNSTVPGPAGSNAFTTVTNSFTIPAFNAQVTATVGSTAFMSVGMALQISGMFFKVAAAPTNATTVSLTNSVAGQTGTIAALARVVVSGEAGPAGTPGTSSGGVGGLQYTNLNTAGTPTAGQIRSADINYIGASTVSISATDAQTTPKSTADVLARLKVGAIIEIAASNANKVRGTITANYSSGTNSFNWDSQIVAGSIANNTTVYLSIVSDPVSGGGGQIQDEGIDLPSRSKTNFVGAGVTATDDAAGDRTVVTITGGGAGGSGTNWVLTTDPAVNAIANEGYIAGATIDQIFTALPTASVGSALPIISAKTGSKQIVGGQFYFPNGSNDLGVRNLSGFQNAAIELICIDATPTPKKWAVKSASDISHWELFTPVTGAYDSSSVAVFTAIENILTAATLSITLLTTAIKNAINTRITAKKTNSTWASTVFYYGFVGGAITANNAVAEQIDSINFRNPGTLTLSWPSGFTHNASGANGSSAVSTGMPVDKTNFPDAGNVMGFYNTSNVAEDPGGIMGSATFPQHYFWLDSSGFTYKSYKALDATLTLSTARPKGFKAGVRNSATTLFLVCNASISANLGSTPSADASLGNLNLFFAGVNTTASFGAFWVNNAAWSNAQAQAERTDEIAYQTALGRN